MKESMIIILLILSLLSSSFCSFRELPKNGQIRVIPDTEVYLDLSSFKVGDLITINITINLFFAKSRDTYSFYIDQVPASSWDNYDYWTNLTKVKYIDESSVSGDRKFKWEEKKKGRKQLYFYNSSCSI